MPAQVLVKTLNQKAVEKLVAEAGAGDLLTIDTHEEGVLVAAREIWPPDQAKKDVSSAAVQMLADADAAARAKK